MSVFDGYITTEGQNFMIQVIYLTISLFQKPLIKEESFENFSVL